MISEPQLIPEHLPPIFRDWTRKTGIISPVALPRTRWAWDGYTEADGQLISTPKRKRRSLCSFNSSLTYTWQRRGSEEFGANRHFTSIIPFQIFDFCFLSVEDESMLYGRPPVVAVHDYIECEGGATEAWNALCQAYFCYLRVATRLEDGEPVWTLGLEQNRICIVSAGIIDTLYTHSGRKIGTEKDIKPRGTHWFKKTNHSSGMFCSGLTACGIDFMAGTCRRVLPGVMVSLQGFCPKCRAEAFKEPALRLHDGQASAGPLFSMYSPDEGSSRAACGGDLTGGRHFGKRMLQYRSEEW